MSNDHLAVQDKRPNFLPNHLNILELSENFTRFSAFTPQAEAFATRYS